MTTENTCWQGEPAVRLRGGDYEALILPRIGANCVSLRHLPTGGDFLRTPESPAALRAAPCVYGLPLLFPPNRIRDGRFTFNGRLYQLPVNEPTRGNHIHGLLANAPFEADGEGFFLFRADEARPYPGFPHAFTVRRVYRLDENGLAVETLFRNDGETAMPLATGIHAAWNVPFLPGTAPEEYALQIPALGQWLIGPVRCLPTGERLSDSPVLTALRQGVLRPEAQPLSMLLRCGDGPVKLSCKKGAFLCERGERYPFVMLWNGGGGQGFCCPEPQSAVTDAPNRPEPPAETGMDSLPPGAEKVYRLRYFFESAE